MSVSTTLRTPLLTNPVASSSDSSENIAIRQGVIDAFNTTSFDYAFQLSNSHAPTTQHCQARFTTPNRARLEPDATVSTINTLCSRRLDEIYTRLNTHASYLREFSSFTQLYRQNLGTGGPDSNTPEYAYILENLSLEQYAQRLEGAILAANNRLNPSCCVIL